MNIPELTKPRKHPRQQRSRFTVDQILEAAAHIFADRGYAGTTTNLIAHKAGVSIGSLYQYFPNKNAILTALLEQHINTTRAELTQTISMCIASEDSMKCMLASIIGAMIKTHSGSPKLHQVLIAQALNSPEITQKITRAKAEMIKTVEQLLKRFDSLSFRNVGHSAYIIVHVLELLVHEYLMHPPENMNQQVLVDEMSTLLSGYACNAYSTFSTEQHLSNALRSC